MLKDFDLTFLLTLEDAASGGGESDRVSEEANVESV